MTKGPMEYSRYIKAMETAGDLNFVPDNITESRLLRGYLELRSQQLCVEEYGLEWMPETPTPGLVDSDGSPVSDEEYAGMLELVRATWLCEVYELDTDPRIVRFGELLEHRAKLLCELDGQQWPDKNLMAAEHPDWPEEEVIETAASIRYCWVYRVFLRDKAHGVDYSVVPAKWLDRDNSQYHDKIVSS